MEEAMVWKFHLTAIGAVLLLSTGSHISAADTVGTCKTTKTQFRESFVQITTNSTAFVPIPNTRISFVKGGSSAGCVMVNFTADVLNFGSARMNVQISFDGNTVDQTVFSTEDSSTGRVPPTSHW
jgi:hypothetical protein